jgi:RNA polymerase sigma-70 factor (ECF subfamily)
VTAFQDFASSGVLPQVECCLFGEWCGPDAACEPEELRRDRAKVGDWIGRECSLSIGELMVRESDGFSTVGAGRAIQVFLDATLPHSDSVYWTARRAGNDHHRAQDFVQETYLRAFAGFGGLKGSSTRAWLVAICLNLIRSEGRRRSRRVQEVPFDDLRDHPVSGRDLADEVIAALDADRLTLALERLPERHRLAVILMDLVGMSASEIARSLGCPRGTVLSWVYRGHRALAAYLTAGDSKCTNR